MSIDMVIENSELILLRTQLNGCAQHIYFLGVPNTSESTRARPTIVWGAPSGIGGIY